MITLIFLFGAACAQQNTAYTDNFARMTMYPLSAAAYSNDPIKCAKIIDPDAKEVEQVTIYCGDENTCSGYTAVLPSKNVIVIGFRGSKTKKQALSIVAKTIATKRCRWKADTGQVAKYFYDAFDGIWNSTSSETRMGDNVIRLVKDYPSHDIWITGHSLGGALAALAASYIVESGIVPNGDKIRLVTFGQPKVGDRNFANLLNKRVKKINRKWFFLKYQNFKIKYSFRVVHHHDLVVRIPLFFYTHQRTEVLTYFISFLNRRSHKHSNLCIQILYKKGMPKDYTAYERHAPAFGPSVLKITYIISAETLANMDIPDAREH
ncbi:unnamed protein product [Strongylus vulgaris]|uniref:Fungal lipase-type domain-containing protein n=1 Tax=Strongylus vulgaris TaxID=40348 RepID=A0A3P7J7G1_STRVU|nr:unnamed protein product [Strongylus vulgaris]